MPRPPTQPNAAPSLRRREPRSIGSSVGLPVDSAAAFPPGFSVGGAAPPVVGDVDDGPVGRGVPVSGVVGPLGPLGGPRMLHA
ncbi:MAG TPA: hypothetical protein VKZ81_04805, partial [Pseudonocardia sp.]|uniref:hypothetical protein n=1 Tax=Pseudonocardia sp. TaxID=60912 RepID=UPI002B4B30D4